MKVILINGSPHAKGNTFSALKEISDTLIAENINTEIITVGDKVISGCIACGSCSKTGKCFRNDIVSEIQQKMSEADGVIIGTPVYFASPNGTLISILDRVFCVRNNFVNKPAASVAVARRAGTTASLDVINKYFLISGMPIVASQYWNMVFGNDVGDVEKDEEGLQTMRILGKRMAYMIKCFDLANKNGLYPPQPENHIYTNFIKNN